MVPERDPDANRAVNAPPVQADNAPPVEAEVPPVNPAPVPEPPVNPVPAPVPPVNPVPVPDDFENADWGEPVVAIEPVAPVGRYSF